jgi:hypothetical protein
LLEWIVGVQIHERTQHEYIHQCDIMLRQLITRVTNYIRVIKKAHHSFSGNTWIFVHEHKSRGIQMLTDEGDRHRRLISIKLGHVEIIHEINQLLCAGRTIIDASLAQDHTTERGTRANTVASMKTSTSNDKAQLLMHTCGCQQVARKATPTEAYLHA